VWLAAAAQPRPRDHQTDTNRQFKAALRPACGRWKFLSTFLFFFYSIFLNSGSDHLHVLRIPIGYRTCPAVVVPQQQALSSRQSELGEPRCISNSILMSIHIMVTPTLW
jgi:hypothetical protein